MPANRKLLVLPGDGIGPEVMKQVVRVADWFGDKRAVGFEVQEDLVGGAAYDAHGTPLTDATLAAAMDRMPCCLALSAARNMTMRRGTSGRKRAC